MRGSSCTHCNELQEASCNALPAAQTAAVAAVGLAEGSSHVNWKKLRDMLVWWILGFTAVMLSTWGLVAQGDLLLCLVSDMLLSMFDGGHILFTLGGCLWKWQPRHAAVVCFEWRLRRHSAFIIPSTSTHLFLCRKSDGNSCHIYMQSSKDSEHLACLLMPIINKLHRPSANRLCIPDVLSYSIH